MRLNVKTKESEDPMFEGGPTTMAVSIGVKKKADADADFVDEVWGTDIIGSKGGDNGGDGGFAGENDADEAPGTGRRTRPATKAKARAEPKPGASRRKPSVETSVETGTPHRGAKTRAAGALTSSPADAKRLKEIAAAEQCNLSGVQLLLSMSENFSQVTPATFGKFVAKLQARLTPTVISHYCSDYDPSKPDEVAPSRGLTVLIRDLQKKFDLAGRILLAIRDTSISASVFAAALRDCHGSGMQVRLVLKEMALCRELQQAQDAKAWHRCAKALDLHSDTPGPTDITLATDEDYLCFETANAADMENMQSRFLAKLLCDMTRAEDATDNVLEFCKNLEGAKLMSESMREEIKMLMTLLAPWDIENSLEDLRRTTQQFKTNTALKLHKTMSVFPTGLRILDTAEKARAARLRDDALQAELICIVFPKCFEVAEAVTEPALQIVDAAKWFAACKVLHSISARASSQFKTRSSYLDAVSRVTQACDTLESAVVASTSKMLKDTFASMASVLQTCRGSALPAEGVPVAKKNKIEDLLCEALKFFTANTSMKEFSTEASDKQDLKFNKYKHGLNKLCSLLHNVVLPDHADADMQLDFSLMALAREYGLQKSAEASHPFHGCDYDGLRNEVLCALTAICGATPATTITLLHKFVRKFQQEQPAALLTDFMALMDDPKLDTSAAAFAAMITFGDKFVRTG